MGTRLMKGLGLKRLVAQWRLADPSHKRQAFSSTVSFSDIDEKDGKGREGIDDFKGPRKNKENEFRGVHRAIICGKVGQVPVQKILTNGHTVTVFTVGTGGMFDQRIVADNLPMPAQWHRIAVHNEELGAYSVQKLVKNAAVYVEGDIETRVYNDRINDQLKNIPEICVRRDGKIRLLQSGESDVSKSLDELKIDDIVPATFWCGRGRTILVALQVRRTVDQDKELDMHLLRVLQAAFAYFVRED